VTGPFPLLTTIAILALSAWGMSQTAEPGYLHHFPDDYRSPYAGDVTEVRFVRYAVPAGVDPLDWYRQGGRTVATETGGRRYDERGLLVYEFAPHDRTATHRSYSHDIERRSVQARLSDRNRLLVTIVDAQFDEHGWPRSIRGFARPSDDPGGAFILSSEHRYTTILYPRPWGETIGVLAERRRVDPYNRPDDPDDFVLVSTREFGADGRMFAHVGFRQTGTVATATVACRRVWEGNREHGSACLDLFGEAAGTVRPPVELAIRRYDEAGREVEVRTLLGNHRIHRTRAYLDDALGNSVLILTKRFDPDSGELLEVVAEGALFTYRDADGR
jgi:hypothetical protein